MGLAWMANLAFNTVDMLMLGVCPILSRSASTAPRIASSIRCCMAYYLLTGVLYPQLARQTLLSAGVCCARASCWLCCRPERALALLVAAFRRPVSEHRLRKRLRRRCAALLLLACCIPLDFLTSYLSNAYIAWSMEAKRLLCTAVAAGSNVVLNLATIPRYGAWAAAVNTLISYGVFLACLAWAGRSVSAATSYRRARV